MSSYVNQRLSHRVGVKKLSLRVGVKKLTTIVKNDKGYETVPGDNKPTTIEIKIVDVSTGGLCIESKYNLKSGVAFDLEILKIKNLDAATLRCETTRSIFREDPLYHTNLGTDKANSYYETGLKFKSPNTEYINQLVELALAKKI